MRVLFVIGNGFDINLHLKTRYSDFYSYAKEKIPENLLIKKIVENEEAWSDFEVALGQSLEEYNNESIDEYINSFEEFILEFGKYLNAQMKTVDHLYSEEICEALLSCFLTFFDHLNLDDKEVIRKRIHDTHENIIIDSLEFNYTGIFSKLMYDLKKKHESFGEFKNAFGTYHMILDRSLQLHGTIENMIMGENDISQIKNEELAKNREIATTFVKPMLNATLRNGNNSRAQTMIEQSNIICLFGTSMGETDKKWWDLIGKRLINNADCYLCIYYYLDTSNRNVAAFRMGNIKNEIVDRFLSYIDANDELKRNLTNRIFISFEDTLFSLL